MNNVDICSHKSGYRGYVTSREVCGSRYPQRLQNILIRDYAARNGMFYLLSATEYSIPSCYIMLEEVMHNLEELEGVIFFSIHLLPRRRQRRQRIYDTILDSNCSLHFALENLRVVSIHDLARIEDIICLTQMMSRES